MDFKVFAKQLLRSKRQMEAARQNLEDEIFMLEEAKSSIGSGGGGAMPQSDGTNRFEDKLIKLICICDDLSARKRNIEINLKCIERGMEPLSDNEKEILHIFFIDGGKAAADVAMERFHKERSSVYRDMEKALDKFTHALYGTNIQTA